MIEESAGRRWSRRVGLVLIATGLVILGYLAWQLWGTNWQSERKHREIVQGLEQQWQAAAEEEWPGGSILRIPRFGEDYAVPVLPGIDDDVLASGFGHFEGSAGPGEVGNFALAGHRITHGEPLRRMPELQPGDQIVVETATHVHTYVLDTGGDDLVVPFTETWVLDPVPVNPHGGVQPPPSRKKKQRLITLTTCSELFRTDDRMIAFGHLVESVEK